MCSNDFAYHQGVRDTCAIQQGQSIARITLQSLVTRRGANPRNQDEDVE
jgi:hypothetical protein